MADLVVGKFVSSSYTDPSVVSNKIPIVKGNLSNFVLVALGEQSIKNGLNLDSFKSVDSSFDKESNSIFVRVSF